MLRNTKMKLFLSLLLIITLIAPFSFAENEIDTEITNNEATSVENIAETDENTVDSEGDSQTRVKPRYS